LMERFHFWKKCQI